MCLEADCLSWMRMITISRKGLSYLLGLYIASAILISELPGAANISQGIGVALAFFFLIDVFAQHRRILLPREMILFSIFFVYTIIGGFLAHDLRSFLIAEFGLLQLLILSIISYHILRNRSAVALAMRSFVVAVAVAGAFAFLGTDTSSNGRLESTLGNPNLYGLMLLFAIAICAYRFIQSSRKWEKTACLLLVPFFAYQIHLTDSRKAIMGLLLFPIIIFGLYVLRHFRNRPGQVIVGLMVFVGILLGTLYIVDHSPYFARLQSVSRVVRSGDITLVGSSDGVRVDLYRAAYATWRDYPLFGVGTKQFKFYTDIYVPGLRNVYAHSNPMEVLANFGLIGASLYYAIYASVLIKLLRVRRMKLPTRDQASLYVLLALVIMFIILELAWVTYNEKATWILLSIVIAQTDNVRKEYGMEKSCET